ncbi:MULTISPECIES: hypothetical protein [unclassified Pseudofrankia]|uniref:hypothetical protein n=1 Tax=unclassified Pseudofrankia TaxID=2994372 RepID=UPI0008DB06BA|nr:MULTISPECIES: hypothetical protein [unclassified Pseudofrankia]MDT3445242.1 hypothetical protein [Pseudofrankia sp. BMG5.37]OHV51878.1 hypothetical protein BCD48_09765 [Pseudofrankia sp. BMG5.36]
MSPRRTRPERRAPRSGQTGDSADDNKRRPSWLVDAVVVDGEDWAVRPVTGAASTKAYRCPGCDHEIPPGVPHVVAWPSGRMEHRRHWHTPCWNRRRAGARPYRAPY